MKEVVWQVTGGRWMVLVVTGAHQEQVEGQEHLAAAAAAAAAAAVLVQVG